MSLKTFLKPFFKIINILLFILSYRMNGVIAVKRIKRLKFIKSLILLLGSVKVKHYRHHSKVISKISQSEINVFYKYYYSSIRFDFKDIMNKRDLQHYSYLIKKLGNFFKTKKTILNFGSGHGGISHLFKLSGHKVINLDPHVLPNQYTRDYIGIDELSSVKSSSIDFFYASHSLEHVLDINILESEMLRVLKKNNYVFFEVPNEESKFGYFEKKIINFPHIYYFKKSFFNYRYSKVIDAKFYSASNKKFVDDHSSGNLTDSQAIQILIKNFKLLSNEKA